MTPIKILFATLGAVLLGGCHVVRQNELVGTAAKDFEVQTLQSSNLTATLSSMKGKVVLLDFWATTCGPCRMLNPALDELYDKYSDKGLEAMAISDEPRDLVQNFMTRTPHRIPVYLDPNEVAHLQYDIKGMPTVVVIGRDGLVTHVALGVARGDVAAEKAKLEAAIVEALAKPSARA